MTCDHVSRVAAWGLDLNGNYTVSKYDCIHCGEESATPFIRVEAEAHTHTSYVEGCFACKVPTLHLNPGDAAADKAMSSRKWNSELNAYADARAQGIQPAGTRMGQIQAAMDASDTLGRAYDAGTMPKAESLTKNHAQVMKEVGI